MGALDLKSMKKSLAFSITEEEKIFGFHLYDTFEEVLETSKQHAAVIYAPCGSFVTHDLPKLDKKAL